MQTSAAAQHSGRVCNKAAAAETKFGGKFGAGKDKELDVNRIQFALNMFLS